MAEKYSLVSGLKDSLPPGLSRTKSWPPRAALPQQGHQKHEFTLAGPRAMTRVTGIGTLFAGVVLWAE